MHPLLAVVEPEPEPELLALRAATGDEAAWQALWQVTAPDLHRLIARPGFLGRLGTREDDRHNLVLEVMARLRADGCRRLVMFAEAHRANPQLRFATWLRVVAKRVGVDYLRGLPEYVDGRHRGEAGAWRAVEPLPPSSQHGVRPPMTDLGTAHELARHAHELPDAQRAALEQWLGGADHAAIAAALGLPHAIDGERLVRAALERLRRRVRSPEVAS